MGSISPYLKDYQSRWHKKEKEILVLWKIYHLFCKYLQGALCNIFKHDFFGEGKEIIYLIIYCY